MLYTIVESFTPANEEHWNSYIKWRGIAFEKFDSIDGMVRCSLFDCPNDDEWSYVVNKDHMLHLIKDYKFAQQKHKELGEGELLSVNFNKHDVNDINFLGFDLIDGCYDISLLTNWGNDNEIINQALSQNALITDFKVVKSIQKHLIENYSNDGHVGGCQIVYIYKT